MAALFLCLCLIAATIIPHTDGSESSSDVPASLSAHLRRVHLLRADDLAISRSRRSSGMTISCVINNVSMTMELVPDQELFAFSPKIYLMDGDRNQSVMDVDTHNFFKGYIVNDPLSSVSMYINNNTVSASIHTSYETYTIESAEAYYGLGDGVEMIAYSDSDIIEPNTPVTSPSYCGNDEQVTLRRQAETIPTNVSSGNNQKQRRFLASSVANTCTLTVVSSSSFYLIRNGGDSLATARAMISRIAAADLIYRATSFGSGLQGLGLSVREIIIQTNPATDPYVIGPSDTVNTLLNKFSTTSTRDFSASCLAHLFTHNDFANGILGLAWIAQPTAGSLGGICSSQSFNTGLSTTFSFGNVVPQRTMELVTTHETGHGFGSPHDTTAACAPSAAQGGHFIMFATASDGSQSNNNIFSMCSLAAILPVLQTKATCFVPKPAGTCGDHIVQSNEACDAGGADQCCTSTCQLQPQAKCSDANNACCSNCTAAVGKPCFQSSPLDSLCRASASCVVNTAGQPSCMSPLPSKAAGTPCGSSGRCSGNSQDAVENRCVSFCSRFGGISCQCSGTSECQTCCIHNPSLPSSSSTCGSPFKAFTDSKGNFICTPASVAVTQAATGNVSSCFADNPSNIEATRYTLNPKYDPTCTDSSSWLCLRVLDLLSGTPCSTGTCNGYGVCISPSPSSTYSFPQWAKFNAITLIYLFTLFAWIPVCFYVWQSDLQKKFEDPNYGVKYMTGFNIPLFGPARAAVVKSIGTLKTLTLKRKLSITPNKDGTPPCRRRTHRSKNGSKKATDSRGNQKKSKGEQGHKHRHGKGHHHHHHHSPKPKPTTTTTTTSTSPGAPLANAVTAANKQLRRPAPPPPSGSHMPDRQRFISRPLSNMPMIEAIPLSLSEVVVDSHQHSNNNYSNSKNKMRESSGSVVLPPGVYVPIENLAAEFAACSSNPSSHNDDDSSSQHRRSSVQVDDEVLRPRPSRSAVPTSSSSASSSAAVSSSEPSSNEGEQARKHSTLSTNIASDSEMAQRLEATLALDDMVSALDAM